MTSVRTPVAATVARKDGPVVAGRRALRAGPVSGVLRVRMLVVVAVGVALMLLLAAVNIGRGDFPITPGEVLNVLAGGGARGQRFVIMELRLPRTLTGLLVGGALGLSGAITQTVARNALASPDVLGVTSGATVGAVTVIVLGGATGGWLTAVGLPVAALAGGLGVAALVYLIAYRQGVDGQRLILVGVGVSAVGASITSWLLVVAQVQDAARATVWFTGSLSGRAWEHVVPIGVTLAALTPFALVCAFWLAALQLGDDNATALGIRINRVRAVLVVLAVVLAAVATSSAGPIAFVALVVPQICQRLVRCSRPPLLASAVFGGLLVIAADLLARTVAPTEQPVGVVTAVLGAPYLLYLLARRNRKVTV